MKKETGATPKHLLFFIFGMSAIFCVFVYLLGVQQIKQERWGISPPPESAKLEPESSVDKILKNIFDVQKAIHQVYAHEAPAFRHGEECVYKNAKSHSMIKYNI